MKKIIAALVFTLATTSPAFADMRVTVPEKTPLTLVSDNVLISTVAVNPGDLINFHLKDDLILNGYVVAKAGAIAEGHFVSGGGVEVSQHLFSAKVEQRNIVFSLDFVTAADGEKIKLDGTNQSPHVTNQAQGNFFFGHKQSAGVGLVNKGTLIQAYVDHTVHVMARQQASSNGGYAQ